MVLTTGKGYGVNMQVRRVLRFAEMHFKDWVLKTSRRQSNNYTKTGGSQVSRRSGYYTSSNKKNCRGGGSGTGEVQV